MAGLLPACRQSLGTMVHVGGLSARCALVCPPAAAMKLVAEAFPWGPHSRLLYTRDNHNSALGIREEALAAGASATAVDFCRPGSDLSDEGALRPCLVHASCLVLCLHAFWVNADTCRKVSKCGTFLLRWSHTDTQHLKALAGTVTSCAVAPRSCMLGPEHYCCWPRLDA